MVLGGIVGTLLFGWTTYDEFFASTPPPLSESELTYFRGRASQARVVPMRYGFSNFRVWLEGHPVAFQDMMQAGDGDFDRAAFERIEPGAEVVVGVKTATVDHPGVDRSLNQPFLSFVSLVADKQQISSLAGYNEQLAETGKTDFFQPVLLACSLFTLGMGISVRGAASREDAHERASEA